MFLIDEISTPIGNVLAGATSEGICMLEYTDGIHFGKRVQKVEHFLKLKAIKGKNLHLLKLTQLLQQYFRKQEASFSLPLVFCGTDFQQTVWESLRQIPYGKTFTYGGFANIINQPDAIRAVASAIGQNHISILVPCHRIVGSDNKLTGYSGGLWRKHWLLKHETGRSTGTGELPFSYDDLFDTENL